MEDKLNILKKHLPKAALLALTPEAVEAVPLPQIEDDLILMHHFPYKVGRESRVKQIDGRLERVERPKKDDSEPNNDLYLVDRGHLLNISREHFQIEQRDGAFYLVDRGSACGTKIGRESVGGDDTGGAQLLNDGDIIAIGAKSTPYVYRFISFTEYDVVLRQHPQI